VKNTQVEINLGALRSNVQRVRAALRPGTELMFVVKADAYGHGLVPVARCAAAAGASWFAVAHLHEALELRRVLPASHILLLGVAGAAECGAILDAGIVPSIVNEEQGVHLARTAAARGRKLSAHLKLDTGMGRLGVSWSEALPVAQRLRALPALDLAGVFTHFASIELARPSLGAAQMERFLSVATEMEALTGHHLFKHVSSSRAFQYHADWDLDAVRPGIILYGYGSGERHMRVRTEPVLSWRTQVAQVKAVPGNFPVGYYSAYVTSAPTTIATLAAGYADGYPRALGNRGFVLLGGRRCPVVGRVSMNWLTVDCGPDAPVRVGDEAVLIGAQDGEAIWADELARLAKTIPYEILTSIHASAERVVVGVRP
jgi:alanine racemase